MNKKPMNAGMKALKKEAPDVAKKMGYNKGGAVTKKGLGTRSTKKKTRKTKK